MVSEEVQKTSLPISNLDVLKNDERILLCKMRLISTAQSNLVKVGDSAKYTIFDLEAIKKAQPTLYNKPMVAIWNDWQQDFEGHAKDDYDRTIREVVGVIPESCEPTYVEEDGETYFEVIVAFWKMYAPVACAKILDNSDEGLKTKLSMEVTLDDVEVIDDEGDYGVLRVKEFTYNGVSLLGQKLDTGMVDAYLDVVTYSAIQEGNIYEDMVQETAEYMATFSAENNSGKDNKKMLTQAQKEEILSKAVDALEEKTGKHMYLKDFDDEKLYAGNWKGTYAYKYTIDEETNVGTIDEESKVEVMNAGWMEVKSDVTYATYAELQEQLATKETEYSALAEEVEKLKVDYSALEVESTNAKDSLATKEAEYSTLEGEYQTLKESVDNLQGQVDSISGEYSAYKEEVAPQLEKLAQYEAERNKNIEEEGLKIITQYSTFITEQEKAELETFFSANKNLEDLEDKAKAMSFNTLLSRVKANPLSNTSDIEFSGSDDIHNFGEENNQPKTSGLEELRNQLYKL